MEQEFLSEDEIIAQEQRSYRKRMRAAIFSGVVLWPLFAFGIIMLWGRLEPIINSPELPGTVALIALLIVPPIAFGAGVHFFLRWRYPAAKEAQREHIVHRRIDAYQTQRRWVTLLVLLVFLQEAYDMAEHPPQLNPNAAFGWLFAAMFVLMTILFSIIACFGRGLIRTTNGEAANDELARSLRARAVQLGYVTSMAGLCTTYLAILYQPAWAAFAFPSVMFVGVSVPIIYFQILEWRAGRLV